MRKDLIGGVMAIFALIAAPETARAQSDGAWGVGLIVPTTGAVAALGLQTANTLKWWIDERNKAGGIKGKKIELSVCNDENNPEKSVTCARDLIAKKPVMMIIGALTASVRAATPLLVNGPVTIVTSPNAMPAPDTFLFQTLPSAESVTEAIADALLAAGHRKLGMIAATDTSGEINANAAREIFPKRGIELILTRIDLRATDASSQMARVAGSDIPIIYSSFSGRGSATVVKSYYNLGLDKPFVIGSANTSNAFLAEIKDVMPRRLLGVTFRASVPVLLKDSADRARAEAFNAAYEKSTGERVDQVIQGVAFQVDTLRALLENLPNPYDAKAAKHYLETTPIPSLQTLRWSATNHVAIGSADTTLVEQKNGVWSAPDPL